MARPEIERILSCDESGRAAIEKARDEAEELLAGAEKEIASYRSKAQAELDEFRQKEISRILEDADRRAAEVERQARDYCDGLEKSFEGRRQDLLSEFLRLFKGEAGLEE